MEDIAARYAAPPFSPEELTPLRTRPSPPGNDAVRAEDALCVHGVSTVCAMCVQGELRPG